MATTIRSTLDGVSPDWRQRRVFRTLMINNLIDEYKITIFPIVLGSVDHQAVTSWRS